MTWKQKILIALGIIALISTLLIIIKYQHDQLQKQKEISNSLVEQKQLMDNIIRAQASYVTEKDLKAFAADAGVDLKPIRDDLNKLHAEIQGIGQVRVVTIGYQGNNIPSTQETPRPTNEQPKPGDNLDPWGYQKVSPKLELEEPFTSKKVPWGKVGFSAWKKEPWDLTIYPREYKVVNVLGQSEDGRHFTYSKFSVIVNGQEHEIKINNATFVEELPDSKFRFSPSLYLGVSGGTYFTDNQRWALEPNLQVFLWSYGRTKVVPDWIIGGVGVGYESLEDRINFIISPVGYNIGNHIPLVNNIYVVPSFAVDMSGDMIILGGVSVGL